VLSRFCSFIVPLFQTLKIIDMKLPWFKRNGIFFIPVSVAGWVLLSGGFACAVYVFIKIDNKSHSVSDTLMNFAFNLLIIGAIYSLIAFLTSRKLKQ
jgi:type II secretory pathway component PulF